MMMKLVGLKKSCYEFTGAEEKTVPRGGEWVSWTALGLGNRVGHLGQLFTLKPLPPWSLQTFCLCYLKSSSKAFSTFYFLCAKSFHISFGVFFGKLIKNIDP